MISDVWLTENDDLHPGAEVFRSDRTFVLLAFVRSHGQLLLSSDRDAEDRPSETMIQICFKPVDAVQIQDCYRGLVIRRATEEEAEQIKAGVSDFGYRDPAAPVFVLESQGVQGYVISSAMGWREGNLSRLQPSLYHRVSSHELLWPTGALAGNDGGAGETSAAEVVQAFVSGFDEGARRDRYRYVYLLLATSADHGRHRPVGVFVTEADAAEAEELLKAHVLSCSTQVVPIVL